MSKTVSIDGATFDVAELTKYLQRGLSLLDTQREAGLDFKELAEEAAEKTKLDKKVVSKWFKARFADKTKKIVADAEMIAALNSAVDD
jgi:hypothetical protein